MSRPLLLRRWPRAIAHLDADAFFASVEQAVHPELKGQPLVTGAERGIVSAASYEAKARGVKRGVPLYEVRRICPECILMPSDYETYALYSKRLFSIMRRFSPLVEEYSIDEGFADLTGLRRLFHASYRDIARQMQEAVAAELGITVSVGVSLSKGLAKLCSKFRKPNGITAVSGRHIHLLLERTTLPQVWGFGPNTVALLEKHGLTTALDFISRPKAFVSALLGKVGNEIWLELRGESVAPVNAEIPSRQASISKTKTFTPPSMDRAQVWARALRNLESACIKARRHRLAAQKLSLFLRTQDFDGSGNETKLPFPTSAPNEIAPHLKRLFDACYRARVLYRATGVVLADLTDPRPSQFSLFDDPKRQIENEALFAAVDEAAARYGKHTIFFADSACLSAQHGGERGGIAQRKQQHLEGETARQHIGLPLLRHRLKK